MKLAPLGSLDKPSLASLDKHSLGSLDRSSVESEKSHSVPIDKPDVLPPKRLNNKPLLGNIDQKFLGSLDKSSLSSVEKLSTASPTRKPRARDFIRGSPLNSPKHLQESEEDNKIRIGNPNIQIGSPANSPNSSVLSGPTRNNLRFGSSKSFLKAESVDNPVDDEASVSEHFSYKDGANVKGILKSSPAKSKDNDNAENVKTLRQAMLQREEKRIMFDLDANIEFASEVTKKFIWKSY